MAVEGLFLHKRVVSFLSQVSHQSSPNRGFVRRKRVAALFQEVSVQLLLLNERVVLLFDDVSVHSFFLHERVVAFFGEVYRSQVACTDQGVNSLFSQVCKKSATSSERVSSLLGEVTVKCLFSEVGVTALFSEMCE